TLNKKEFLNVLEKGLSGLKKEERKDILLDYEIHFAEGIKEGKSEKLICEDLGSPKEIGKLYKANILIDEADKNVSTDNIIKAIIASIGLGIFNIVLVLGPFLGLIGVVIAIFAVSIALVTSGMVIFIDSVIMPISFLYLYLPKYLMLNPTISVFLSMSLVMIGVLIFVLGIFLCRGIYHLTVRYLKFNLKMIKGK
ncbi:MAG: DUF1700 domain-containing protein, partial [Clostridiales bacterium]|nr:DUF1700 domain-containing protein [Clostridiales bacterium]